MKHKDIYTKFMIEYDKAQITSSYPSLTKYETATILDKAYLAIIAQKLTGNNPRGAVFEADVKAIEDVRPLIKSQVENYISGELTTASNELVYKLPEDLLYYINASLNVIRTNNAIDNKKHIRVPVKLINHEGAQNFKNTDYNMPWIKTPVAFIENDYAHVLVDSYKYNKNTGNLELTFTYLKTPKKFVDDEDVSVSEVEFELTDTMAEELINLAIIMSTEIVESQRMTSKSNIRPLES